MKILTLHEPWASLVALGIKQYETRHWEIGYRGELLIHAASRRMRKGDLAILRAEVKGIPVSENLLNEALEKIERSPRYGCIVALSRLTDCLLMTDAVEDSAPESRVINISQVPFLERAVGLWDIDRYAFKLENVQPLSQPISFTSRQAKLLDAPESLVLMVRNQMEVAA